MEKVPKSSIPDIDKKKFLVPADLSGTYLTNQILLALIYKFMYIIIPVLAASAGIVGIV